MKELFQKLFTAHYDRLIAEGRDEIAAYELASEEAYAELGQIYADREKLKEHGLT